MRRGLSLGRLILGGVVFAISWVSYQLADVTECDGPKANAWADATLFRLEESALDYESWDAYANLPSVGPYLARADARYQAQFAEDTISCLEDLHEITVEFFYDEWMMYQAMSQGDYDLAYRYDLASIEVSDAMMQKLDEMAAKYDWDEE